MLLQCTASWSLEVPSSLATRSYLKKLIWSYMSNTSKQPKIAQKTKGIKRKCSQSSQKVLSTYRVLTLNIPCIIAVAFSTSRLPLAWCAINSFGWDTYLFAEFLIIFFHVTLVLVGTAVGKNKKVYKIRVEKYQETRAH